ncbi:3-hydroxyacyl-CoA dehydrogenase [Pseudomonas sp. SWI6]|uniref:3-hydroxyacyl-CoA dehydrogenase n=1 Tax=Pseudomonas taiwanensis TaxID=470150 RepID=A0ABR6V9L1_9PSED|nr:MULTISPECIES: 3-hydroxyacyl-CoA dehydrogenase [Pseudomonas]AGZ35325.1 3-hydroxybutyryl-CoA epimerase [Pseudomonas sp. VLB120]AVD83210.1 3-hydroxyacyl-CoA dehydrogenase [Pseudomonas sp. SWI6]AVD90369.1 3-hydroxyacyl-CoA dehydrogenase [Pseudomonas sp. SWI44]MBC3477225.1 3-hydroxyacyl-CoA dehydrogenase [Pseudomonas taiwanensis]MBC3491728.1 3-hydroxyacyl-CoA dehydrogenase [Pseudomonas taiwanensis]
MNTPYNVEQTAVIGAGTMGRGIVISLARAGLPVLWLDNDPRATETGLAMLKQTWAQQVAKGRIDQAEADACLARVSQVTTYADLAQVDLVIEAVYENLALKQEIFRTLDDTLKAEAILASNTSALDIDAIAAVTQRPEQVLGLHFFSPAHVMKLLEVVRGQRTSPAVLDAAQALGQRMGKEVVVAGNCPGFIGNRMLATYVAEARKLLLEGATPRQVDEALQAFGMAMGPFRMYDVVGIDLEWRARQLAGVGMEAPLAQVDNALCALGRFGQKTGKGYYRYAPGSREAVHDPEVDALVLKVAHDLGVRPREIGEAEIRERCLLALVNEGAKILEESVASCSDDIDRVYLHGYGFPADIGGPMRWADQQGLGSLLGRLERLQGLFGEHWRPSGLLMRLAAEGKPLANVREGRA